MKADSINRIYREESNDKFVLVRPHYRVRNGKLHIVRAYYRAKWGTIRQY